MSNKKISELPYIPESEISGNTLVPLVTYYSAVTGTTVHTYVDDLQNYINNNGYWTSGNTGINSVIANNGTGNDASNDNAIAIGNQTTASGFSSFAEGNLTQANGYSSHAEGDSSIAQGDYSHAEGQGSNANGQTSHSEGRSTQANGNYSHAEGNSTRADGNNSHSEGSLTIAGGDSSHAQGEYTNSAGFASHASGLGLFANEITAAGQTSFVHCEVTGLGSSGVFSDNSSILGGIDNLISGSSNNSTIIGGKEGLINTGCTSSTILGGNGNTIVNDVINSVILGGAVITATTSNTTYVPNLVIKQTFTPSGSTDTTGEAGSITWDGTYLYFKNNTGWLRLSGQTF